ncbi:MAG: terminase gpA endonuclease subunit [Planctomycetota bacterium]|jgi:phage terminase large subunit GpA-like protein
MNTVEHIGVSWLCENIDAITDEVIHITPVDFCEQYRYLPESVTPYPGYINFDINPFMVEPLNCFDIHNPIREVNFKKGVQITYTTLLECGIFYFTIHVGTLPMMYMTADAELAHSRIENNIIVMFNQSGFADEIQSTDIGNKRKTGKTKHQIQFRKGAVLHPFGARNADKMRNFSIAVLLKDELDAWPETVGKDGDPDSLSDDRCSAYTERKKIFRGSTPLLKGTSKIEKQYQRGDCRKYMVLCKSCSYPQELRWNGTNKETGHEYGFQWEFENGILVPESVRYACADCGHEHYEHDKEIMFSPDHGAHWKPTKRPISPYIRSYHLPSHYSPVGFKPWYENVQLFLEAYDPVAREVRDPGKLQVFYNNVLAEPYEVPSGKIFFTMVSGHRRTEYRLGQIPNEHAVKHTGGPILFLTCTVDVHKHFLAVLICGWTRDARSYVVDYFRLEDSEEDGCTRPESPVWGRLRGIIEERQYTDDSGKRGYRIEITFIDAGYQNELVCNFASGYIAGVYPIVGRDQSSRYQTIKEFAEFTTQAGTIGFRLNVDYYKDRLAPVLRREWLPESGEQPKYHFNAPVDLSDRALKELTVESIREQVNERTGAVSYYWYRPGNARQELWDLLVYSHAAVEILAWDICVRQLDNDAVDMNFFWDHLTTEQPFIIKL